LFYTTNFSLGKLGKLFGQSAEASATANAAEAPAPAETPAPAQRPKPTVQERDRLTPSFFEKLSSPGDQKALADGCQALALPPLVVGPHARNIFDRFAVQHEMEQ